MMDPLVLELPGDETDKERARRAWQVAALRYSAKKCRDWGQMIAADELERYAQHVGMPPALADFDSNEETTPGRPGLVRTSSVDLFIRS